MLRCLSMIGAALCLSFLVGCGDAITTVPVTGKVMVDSKPAERGVISFLPTDGKGVAAEAVISNGEYKATVPPGAKKVQVRVAKKVGETPAYKGMPNSPMREDVVDVKLEEKAQNLSFNVPASGGPFDVDLKSKK